MTFVVSPDQLQALLEEPLFYLHCHYFYRIAPNFQGTLFYSFHGSNSNSEIYARNICHVRAYVCAPLSPVLENFPP